MYNSIHHSLAFILTGVVTDAAAADLITGVVAGVTSDAVAFQMPFPKVISIPFSERLKMRLPQWEGGNGRCGRWVGVGLEGVGGGVGEGKKEGSKEGVS